MNDVRDHGTTTELQGRRWRAEVNHMPADISIIDRMKSSPATLFVALAVLCSIPLLWILGRLL